MIDKSVQSDGFVRQEEEGEGGSPKREPQDGSALLTQMFAPKSLSFFLPSSVSDIQTRP